MNSFERERQKAKMYKEMYPAGTRIELISMDDPYSPVPPGTCGTVIAVDDMGTVHPKWDNGRTLGVVPGEDSFRKLTPAELAEEQSEVDFIDQTGGEYMDDEDDSPVQSM